MAEADTGTDMSMSATSESAPASKSRQTPKWRLSTVTGALCLGTFLFGLDVNIIGVAIPFITTQFESLSDVSWYGSAYMLTLTAFQPLFGNLYKYFNAKTIYLASLTLFEVGSIISATANVSNTLIVGRAILGLGAAGLLQGALAIIGLLVPIDQVPLYIGIVVSSMVLSVCCGPVIGGALTQYVNWQWCFWINVPAGFVVLVLVFIFVNIDQSSDKSNQALPLRDKFHRMDIPGLVLFLGAVCCLLLALTWGGQTYPWRDSRIIGLFIGFGLLTACFCYWLVRQGDFAIIPLRVLKIRSIYMGSITLVGYGILSVVYGYYLPILFQSVQGVTTTESGVRYIALVGPQIFTVVVAGAIVTTWGHYVPYMIAGGVISSIGAGLLTTVDPDTRTVAWAGYLVMTGIGLGMAAQLPYTALQAVLDPKDVATGNAIAVFSFHLAGAIGLAIGQVLLLDGLITSVPQRTQAVTPAQVIQAGATGLEAIASSPGVLNALRWAYSDAVRRTIVLGLAGSCITVPAACAMDWLNIKRVAEERRLANDSEASTGKEGTPEVRVKALDA
ncbi:hypothetical protein HIM_09702 [Hirsutella minnesotensis 3608]|uniref:Major facilitator superfamily (MFS) profile domain-containing protein n=1 Tax=Hirsutella minnesotensis 3608 TaxID=1043627 RepID=A0A0F8A2Y9_9HYPO|nr:hypothetical protein HIM_09702 [Hirsutella minnesotensis 3608]